MEYQISEGESIFEAVIMAVSECLEDDPHDEELLYEVLNPDALDQLFTYRSGDESVEPGVFVSFVYRNCRVTIENGDYIEIRPVSNPGMEPQV